MYLISPNCECPPNKSIFGNVDLLGPNRIQARGQIIDRHGVIRSNGLTQETWKDGIPGAACSPMNRMGEFVGLQLAAGKYLSIAVRSSDACRFVAGAWSEPVVHRASRGTSSRAGASAALRPRTGLRHRLSWSGKAATRPSRHPAVPAAERRARGSRPKPILLAVV